MKIISKFRDYYDCIQGYGIDQNFVYPRTTEEKDFSPQINSDQYRFVLDNFIGNKRYGDLFVDSYVIGFCGKLFPVYKLVYRDLTHDCGNTRWAYTNKGVEKFFKELNTGKKKREEYLKSYMFGKHQSWLDRRRFVQANVINMFEELHGYDMLSTFVEFNVPVFVIKDIEEGYYHRPTTAKIDLNPCLLDYHFQAIFDPYTAYQEIQMFISGVLGLKEPYMVNISDEHMRDAKGFNEQSFKTRKGQKTRKGKR